MIEYKQICCLSTRPQPLGCQSGQGPTALNQGLYIKRKNGLLLNCHLFSRNYQHATLFSKITRMSPFCIIVYQGRFFKGKPKNSECTLLSLKVHVQPDSRTRAFLSSPQLASQHLAPTSRWESRVLGRPSSWYVHGWPCQFCSISVSVKSVHLSTMHGLTPCHVNGRVREVIARWWKPFMRLKEQYQHQIKNN